MRKTGEAVRAYEERNVDVAQKMELALDRSAKRTNLEELAPNPAQLKENDTTSPATPARPTLRKRREFGYDESEKATASSRT